MSSTSIIIIVTIAVLLVAAYGRDYNDDSLRKYGAKKKRNGRTYKR